ncbi:hypothetical protein FOZ63_003697, partial [Perkinsus olseni]
LRESDRIAAELTGASDGPVPVSILISYLGDLAARRWEVPSLPGIEAARWPTPNEPKKVLCHARLKGDDNHAFKFYPSENQRNFTLTWAQCGQDEARDFSDEPHQFALTTKQFNDYRRSLASATTDSQKCAESLFSFYEVLYSAADGKLSGFADAREGSSERMGEFLVDFVCEELGGWRARKVT